MIHVTIRGRRQRECIRHNLYKYEPKENKEAEEETKEFSL